MNTPGRDLLHVSLGDIIRDVALSIADAQRGLDAASTQTAEFMSGRVMLRDPETGGLIDVDGKPTKTPTVVSSEVMFGQEVNEQGVRIPRLVSMMELGFVPTFYQFVDTTIEMKLSVRLSGASVSQQRLSHRSGAIAHDGRRLVVQATTVDAGFASAYGYQAQLATTVSTKLVPIPPPAALDAHLSRLRIDQRLDLNTASYAQLEALAALGPDRAQALVDERARGGPFRSFDDLQRRVDYIGEKTIDALRGHAHV